MAVPWKLCFLALSLSVSTPLCAAAPNLYPRQNYPKPADSSVSLEQVFVADASTSEPVAVSETVSALVLSAEETQGPEPTGNPHPDFPADSSLPVSEPDVPASSQPGAKTETPGTGDVAETTQSAGPPVAEPPTDPTPPPIPPTISASDSDTPQTPLLPPKSSNPDAPPTIPPLPSGSVDPPVQPPSPSDPPKTTSSEGPGLVTVTGTDSGVITYSPTRYTEYETATETRTTTRDDGLIIIIFPGGWSWIPFGIPGPNPPPPPPAPPTPGPDKPDPSTAKSSGCTLTKPPECTRTVSFISVGSGYSSTVYGECSYATSCATGEQSTTTTVVDVQGQADNEFGDPEEEWPAESGDPDQSSLDFFEAWYDELGISFDSIGNVEAECEGDEAQIDSMCLVRTVVNFCSEVNKDKDKELSIEIPSGGREEQKRSIVRRDVECDGWAFEFVWTGSGGGQCLDNCNGAMAEIIGQCAISDPFRVPEKGKIDAECGTYSYKIKPFTKPTSTSSKSAEPSKTDATPVPPQASNFKCNNPADFIGHIDVSESSVWDSAWSACHRDIAPAEWDTDESKQIGMFDQWEKEHGVGFRYSISWIEGCRVLPDNKQKLWHPEAFYHKYSPDCRLVFSDLWKYCNDNEGVGGAVDYGCIRYEMKAGV